MMRLFFFSVLAGAMIGVMVPTAFAELKENDNIFVKNPDCNISKVVYADGSPVWKPVIKFFDKEGNLVSEHRANTDGEFINTSEGYIIQVIIYENDEVSDYAETYNQCYIAPEPKLPPKPHIPYQEPKQIQEYLDKQKEGLQAPPRSHTGHTAAGRLLAFISKRQQKIRAEGFSARINPGTGDSRPGFLI